MVLSPIKYTFLGCFRLFYGIKSPSIAIKTPKKVHPTVHPTVHPITTKNNLYHFVGPNKMV